MLDINKNRRSYLRRAQEKANLSQKETNELILKAQAGDIEARNKVVEAHLLYVAKVANKYKDVADIDDLIQSGNLGLFLAIKNYKPDKGVSFISYATFSIRGQILVFLAEETMLNTPMRFQSAARNFTKEKDKLHTILQREPTDDEVYEKSKIPKKEVEFVMHHKISENLPLGDGNFTAGDKYFIAEPDTDNSNKEFVDVILKQLDKRDEQIIRMFFGIGCDPKNNNQIAEELGTHFNYVTALKDKALKRLQRIAKADASI